ncbi:MAG TPA: flagellar assembly protein FliW [Oligoflexia bacterium]|nr:flagellar assembly protein FliW [Oligoflexia bacterium]HMP49231.1 flagellar assembly protein FliW [Oligoflexia bacterium]
MSQQNRKISTSRFGELDILDSAIMEIVGGVFGFPAEKNFVLLEYNPPFSWLQCVDNPELAFVVVNAAEFGDDYRVPIPVGDREMDLKAEDEVAIMNLVTVRPDPSMTTVNLRAPIIVSLRTMRGRQLIIDDERYPIRLPLWTPSSGGTPSSA